MRKRTVLLLAILTLCPIWILRDPGRPALPVAFAAVPAVFAQGQAPGDASQAGSMQADPVAADRAKARSRFHYLMLGYGAIWICIGVFLIDLTRKVGRVGAEIAELEARLEAAERGKRI